MKQYAMFGLFYGALHGGFRVAPMDSLPGTKILTILASGAYGPFLLPVYIINDINRTYMWKNNLKFTDYGYPENDTHITDVLFR